MDMASHVNDADDNVDAADDDVYAIYVFIAVTTGSNFLLSSFLFQFFSSCLGERPALRMRNIQWVVGNSSWNSVSGCIKY